MPELSGTDELALRLAGARRVVAFSGAGISTESGIPDFRSPGGVWSRYDPRDFTFAKYVRSRDVRRRSWRLRRELWQTAPRPNPAHRALARFEAAGRLHAVITQNIDGLHQAAGSQRVIELHGTGREVICIGAAPRVGTPDGCGYRAAMDDALTRVAAGEDDPDCPECGGLLKSATVSFGQNLFPGVLEEALAAVAGADLLLTVGSSLQVYPAAGVPETAVGAGVPLVVVNVEPTALDPRAVLVVHGRAGEVLPPAVDAALAARRS